VQLQGYNLAGIIEIWWGGSHDWSVAVVRYGLLWKDRKGKRRGELPFM